MVTTFSPSPKAIKVYSNIRDIVKQKYIPSNPTKGYQLTYENTQKYCWQVYRQCRLRF